VVSRANGVDLEGSSRQFTAVEDGLRQVSGGLRLAYDKGVDNNSGTFVANVQTGP